MTGSKNRSIDAHTQGAAARPSSGGSALRVGQRVSRSVSGMWLVIVGSDGGHMLGTGGSRGRVLPGPSPSPARGRRLGAPAGPEVAARQVGHPISSIARVVTLEIKSALPSR